MLLLMRRIRRTRPGGLSTWATPCSTWVCMNRGTSERSLHNPLGQVAHASVQAANMVVSRMTLLIIWSTLFGVQWLLEQPQSSLMAEQPRLHALLKSVTHFKIPTCMGAFGSATLKGTTLLGSERWMAQLHRSVSDIDPKTREKMKQESKNVSTTTMDATCQKRFTGGPALNATQAYTQQYGREAARLHLELGKPPVIDVEAIHDNASNTWAQYDATDLWQVAQLEEVFCLARDLAGQA